MSLRSYKPCRTYAQAETLLGGRDSVTVANNTLLTRESATEIALRYHGSAIIRYYEDGSYRLSTCGYATVTTKERLNIFTPFSVSQKDWQWYLNGKAWQYTRPEHRSYCVDCTACIASNGTITWEG